MKILQVCVDLDGGGIDRYLLNYCSRIKDIQFDFAIIAKDKRGILEDSIEAMGGRIYRVPRQREGILKNFIALRAIMKKNQYDAVHVHLGYKGLVALLCAWSCGIKTRIVHAHIAYVPESRAAHIARKAMTVPVCWLATALAACGEDAGRWVWGDKAFEQNRVTVHNNAIQASKFKFSLRERDRLRKELGIEPDTLVFGHVGRLSDQKNQPRLVEIFAEIVKREPNARLLLIGRGELEEKVADTVTKLNLNDNVYFLGIRDDVWALLNVMDAFIFPSKYEGLPFTLIETQCNGLYAISSDTVTSKVCVSDCVVFRSLSSSNEEWAAEAINLAAKGHNEEAWKDVQRAGYDIDVEAEKLKDYYFKCVGENHDRKKSCQ